VLSLASISLYAFFKSSSKKDAQLMPAKKTELEKLRALAEKKAQWRQSDDADLYVPRTHLSTLLVPYYST